MKKVLLITTGGTISQSKQTGISVNDSHKTGSFLLSNIKDKIKDVAQIDVIDAYQIDSSDMSAEHWQTLIQIINENKDKYDGFLITHGTNTLGYTSAALSFATPTTKPIALTGAQIPLGDLGSDSEHNLENALRVLIDGKLNGVFVVFGSQIITGTRAKKDNEYSMDAFTSFNNKKQSLGRVDVNLFYYLLQEHNNNFSQILGFAPNFAMDKIAVFTDIPSFNEKVITDNVNIGNTKAIILRASGAGDPSLPIRKILPYLQEKSIPIIVTTHAPNGIAGMDINEPGQIAKNLGAIPAYDTSMESLTAKLSLLIGNGYSYDEICNAMQNNLRGEISVILNKNVI